MFGGGFAFGFGALEHEHEKDAAPAKINVQKKSAKNMQPGELDNYIDNINFVKEEMERLRVYAEEVEKERKENPEIIEDPKVRSIFFENPLKEKFIKVDLDGNGRYEEMRTNLRGVESPSFEEIRKFVALGNILDRDIVRSDIDEEILKNCENALGRHNLKKDKYSLVVDMWQYQYPPDISVRAAENFLFRPVVIDGCAVQHAVSGDMYDLHTDLQQSQHFPYSDKMRIFVEPMIHVLLVFILAGHKAQVYLPRYYMNYLTPDGVSKVDDIAAFERLVDAKLIVFFEDECSTWFNKLVAEVTKTQAAFVSDFQHKRTTVNVHEFGLYGSERIINVSFVCPSEGKYTLVLKPTSSFVLDNKPYSADQQTVLYYPADFPSPSQEIKIVSQLCLVDQIKQICLLTTLIPLKIMYKQAVKTFLAAIRISLPDIELPVFDEDWVMIPSPDKKRSGYATLRDEMDFESDSEVEHDD